MIALIALGGNMPFEGSAPDKTILSAIKALFRHDIQLLQISKIYHTPCFPAGAGPDFANAAAMVQFSGTPPELLATCHEVERMFGRERHVRWSARTLDIDLLAIDDLVLPDRETLRSWIDLDQMAQSQTAPGQMLLPHPRLQDRAFVLVPLHDVAPDWRHPILEKTVAELLEALPMTEKQAITPI